MSNYTKTTDFEAKDSLPTGDSGKIIRGSEFETEFDAISTAIATKADTAGPTFTGTLTFETISDGTIGVTAFVDEDDMSSDSATLVPTQQSVKAYVDSQVTAQDLDFQADSGGALSIDLDTETMTFTGGTGIDTSGALNAVTFAIDSTVTTLTGTQTLTNKTLTSPDVNTPDIDGGTIDGATIATSDITVGTGKTLDVSSGTLTLADNQISGDKVEGGTIASTTITDLASTTVDTTNLEVTNIKAKDGTSAGSIADTTGVVTLASSVLTTTDINGGTIDGATIGGTTAAAGSFTTVSATGNITVDGTVDGRDVATDGTKLDGIEALADVTDTTNVTAAGALMDSELTDITAVKSLDQGVATTDSPTFAGLTTTADVSFGDNDKAVFGAGSDLEIYHDGTDSFIKEGNNTGSLKIWAKNFEVYNADGSETLIDANVNSAVQLYHDNSLKFATTSTGIDVTGTVSGDGLSIGGTSNFTGLVRLTGDRGTFVDSSENSAVPHIFATNDAVGDFSQEAGHLVIQSRVHTSVYRDIIFAGGTTNAKRLMTIQGEGDISFYEDTGTTAKLFWDASAESLGIGTSSPDTQLTLYKASTNADVNYAKMRMDSWGASQGKLKSLVWDDSGNPVAAIGAEYDGSKTNIHFHSQYNGAFKGTSDRTMSIMGNGNVGIGTTSPSGELHVVGTSGGNGDVYVGRTSGAEIHTQAQSALGIFGTSSNHDLVFKTNDTQRMRIDTSGNLLVGTTDRLVADGTGTGLVLGGQSDLLHASRSGGDCAKFNRVSDDGAIVTFAKDGTPVGQINARSGDLVIGTGTTGLQFYDVGNAIFPLSASGNTNRDAAIDLGEASNRFKDLYLSGRVIAHGVTTSSEAWSSQSDSASSSVHLYFRNPNGFVGNISTSGTATAYNTSSDYRLKENVVAMTDATTRLKQLTPKRFNFIADADVTVDGFLAHEVADVVPEAVTGAKDAVDDEGNAVYQGIDQSKLVPLLVATIQELEARIAALESN